MDAMSDRSIRVVALMKGAQVGWTECLNNVIGYYIDQDPTSILVIQPTIEMAESWSRQRLAPMLRDTRALANRVADPKSRDSANNLREKVFPGGQLSIIGANAPSGLASRPIRVVLADEVDLYPPSAGTEGDPLALAEVRQRTFWDKKTLIGSTPANKDGSVILRYWNLSDQRHYMVPCYECGERQYFKWSQVRWDKTEEGEHLPDTAYYSCEHCSAAWDEGHRRAAIRSGEWLASRPGKKIAGFHLPAIASPWLTLEEMVTDFLKRRHDPNELRVFINSMLGEPWEDDYERIESSEISKRGEVWTEDAIPEQIRLITAGVDVQKDRLEIQVVGWGPGEESWVLAYEIVHGDPAQDVTWAHLDTVLKWVYTTAERDRRLRVVAACIDTGGYHANAVHAYTRDKRSRRLFPIKGTAGVRPIWPKRVSRTRAKSNEIFAVGVDTAKDTIYGRLTIKKPGPGYIHFPVDLGKEYYQQLTSEVVETRTREGRPYRIWVLPSGSKNEALDTFVYALAARHSIPIRLDFQVPVPADEEASQHPVDENEELVETATETTPAAVAPRTATLPNYGARRSNPFFTPRKDWFSR